MAEGLTKVSRFDTRFIIEYIVMENKGQNKLKPTFGDSMENGLKVLSDNFISLLLIVLVVGFVQAPIQIFRFVAEISLKHAELPLILSVLGVFLIFAFTYGFLLLSVFDFGSTLMFVKAVRGEKADFHNLVRGFKENYPDIVLANIMVFGIVLLGMAFLIIPGIILSCRLVFVKYLVMDKKLAPMEALEESWRMTEGYAWTIFFLGFISIFIIMFGFLLLIIGVLPAIAYVSSTFASLYEAILTNNGVLEEIESTGNN